MSQSLTETWKPLPADVAEWMGVCEHSVAESRAADAQVPQARNWRDRMRDLVKG